MEFGRTPSIDIVQAVLVIIWIILGGAVFFSLGYAAWYAFVHWLRYRHREQESLNSVLLQVSVPRDNEIKIDAAEQLFASLASLRGSGKLENFRYQPHLSFEIVGLPGDIRYYVNVPVKYRDFVEKQINGAYPEAEITVVNDPSAKQRQGAVVGTEYNIFSENGKVAFMYMNLKFSNYLPIKTY